MDATQVVVLINAECYTAWAVRKACLGLGLHSAALELSFLSLVLRKHPKSEEAWYAMALPLHVCVPACRGLFASLWVGALVWWSVVSLVEWCMLGV